MPRHSKRRRKRGKNEKRVPAVISPLRTNEAPVDTQWKHRYKQALRGQLYPVMPRHHLPFPPKFIGTHDFSFQGWGCGNFGVLGTGNRKIAPVPSVSPDILRNRHNTNMANVLRLQCLFRFLGFVDKKEPARCHLSCFILQRVLSPAEFQEENVVIDVNNSDFMQLMLRRAEQFRCNFKVDSGKTLTVYLGSLRH